MEARAVSKDFFRGELGTYSGVSFHHVPRRGRLYATWFYVAWGLTSCARWFRSVTRSRADKLADALLGEPLEIQIDVRHVNAFPHVDQRAANLFASQLIEKILFIPKKHG